MHRKDEGQAVPSRLRYASRVDRESMSQELFGSDWQRQIAPLFRNAFVCGMNSTEPVLLVRHFPFILFYSSLDIC
jgi:hypothetical protein